MSCQVKQLFLKSQLWNAHQYLSNVTWFTQSHFGKALLRVSGIWAISEERVMAMTGSWRRLNYPTGWAEVVISTEWVETCDRWPSNTSSAGWFNLLDSPYPCLIASADSSTAVRGNRPQMRQHCYNITTITVFLFSSLYSPLPAS